jgi:hypothetical protein
LPWDSEIINSFYDSNLLYYMQRNPISSDISRQIVIDYQKEAKMHFCFIIEERYRNESMPMVITDQLCQSRSLLVRLPPNEYPTEPARLPEPETALCSSGKEGV